MLNKLFGMCDYCDKETYLFKAIQMCVHYKGDCGGKCGMYLNFSDDYICNHCGSNGRIAKTTNGISEKKEIINV